jgi:hypothetical protein
MKNVEGGTAESVRLRNKLRDNVCGVSGFNSNLALKVSTTIPSVNSFLFSFWERKEAWQIYP